LAIFINTQFEEMMRKSNWIISAATLQILLLCFGTQETQNLPLTRKTVDPLSLVKVRQLYLENERLFVDILHPPTKSEHKKHQFAIFAVQVPYILQIQVRIIL